MLNMFLHFFVYFPLSTINAPIFLSWRSSIMCGFSSLYLYGTLIVLYFLHVLLNFVLKTMIGWNLCWRILLSGKLVTLILCIALWYWASNSVQTRLAFFDGVWWSSPNHEAAFFNEIIHRKTCCRPYVWHKMKTNYTLI